MRKKHEVTGNRFGMLVAIRFDHMYVSAPEYWIFQCDCGHTKTLNVLSVIRGEVENCGCIKTEATLKQKEARMSKKRRERQKANKRKFKQEQNLSTKNAFGFTDLTPYNAISGKEAMSKPTLTDMRHEVSGGFNTKKK